MPGKVSSESEPTVVRALVPFVALVSCVQVMLKFCRTVTNTNVHVEHTCMTHTCTKKCTSRKQTNSIQNDTGSRP